MKIATWLEHYKGGGVERVAVRLARDWAELGHHVAILASPVEEHLRASLPPDVEWVPHFGGRKTAPAAIGEVAPDVFFCPGNHYTSTAARIRLHLKDRSPPIVWKISNDLARRDFAWPMRFANGLWVRQHHRFTDRVVAMSRAMADDAVMRTGISREFIDIIENPHMAVGGGQVAEPPPGRYVLGIGRLEPQKDWALAIRAFAQADTGGRSLYIYGEGSERARLTALIDRLGMNDRIHLPGFVEGLERVIGNADLLLLTSRYEGRPNVVIEALSAGSPVVATESSVAMRELLADPASGRLLPDREPRAVARAIEQVLLAPRPDPRRDTGTPLTSARAYLDTFSKAIAQLDERR
ncbi:glycosyltransferase [Alteriqipengyuania sp. 357]